MLKCYHCGDEFDTRAGLNGHLGHCVVRNSPRASFRCESATYHIYGKRFAPIITQFAQSIHETLPREYLETALVSLLDAIEDTENEHKLYFEYKTEVSEL